MRHTTESGAMYIFPLHPETEMNTKAAAEYFGVETTHAINQMKSDGLLTARRAGKHNWYKAKELDRLKMRRNVRKAVA